VTKFYENFGTSKWREEKFSLESLWVNSILPRRNILYRVQQLNPWPICAPSTHIYVTPLPWPRSTYPNWFNQAQFPPLSGMLIHNSHVQGYRHIPAKLPHMLLFKETMHYEVELYNGHLYYLGLPFSIDTCLLYHLSIL
jgi:hypothetical protein